MNKELVIRARNMALSYALGHLITQGILPAESWKECADSFIEDRKDNTLSYCSFCETLKGVDNE